MTFYRDLRGTAVKAPKNINLSKMRELCRILRGLIFTTIDHAKTGHPGGSSSKVEALIALLCSDAFRFDPWDPKHVGRDRIVWSAGHCSPLAHSLNCLVKKAMEHANAVIERDELRCYFSPDDLLRFRTLGGPSGHVESHYALEDASTGSSGHGLSDALGRAMLMKSCGLPMKVYCVMGDAETEEGMTFEARNVAAKLGLDNLVAILDRNGFGIDGPTSEAMGSVAANQWTAFDWNVIEADGHSLEQLLAAYATAEELRNKRPTVIIAHTTKGLHYGKLQDTCTSHGTPLPHDGYVEAMRKLGYEITVDTSAKAVMESFFASSDALEALDYFFEMLLVDALRVSNEKHLIHTMNKVLAGRPSVDYRQTPRPTSLPAELIFKEGEGKATRFATEACFKWEMENNPFFYVGTGDLSSSILTRKAEDHYGIINAENPLGRGVRWGIAEQNMAMASVAISQETLPGGKKPMAAFASYGVFTSMMANSVRMGLVNNAMSPETKGFFIMLAAHDGPETGEDGPTHHGLFWMSLFMAYPGIKVYKPLDANEAVEMYFHARAKGEPVAFSVARPNTPVFIRNDTTGIPAATSATLGAYIFKKYDDNGKKKLPIVVAGGQMAANLQKALPKITEKYDVKIVAVTSPELFAELRKDCPEMAERIFAHNERARAVGLHNGWPGFLYTLTLPERTHGITEFLASGRPDEIYLQAGFHPEGIAEKVLATAASDETVHIEL